MICARCQICYGQLEVDYQVLPSYLGVSLNIDFMLPLLGMVKSIDLSKFRFGPTEINHSSSTFESNVEHSSVNRNLFALMPF